MWCVYTCEECLWWIKLQASLKSHIGPFRMEERPTMFIIISCAEMFFIKGHAIWVLPNHALSGCRMNHFSMIDKEDCGRCWKSVEITWSFIFKKLGHEDHETMWIDDPPREFWANSLGSYPRTLNLRKLFPCTGTCTHFCVRGAFDIDIGRSSVIQMAGSDLTSNFTSHFLGWHFKEKRAVWRLGEQKSNAVWSLLACIRGCKKWKISQDRAKWHPWCRD